MITRRGPQRFLPPVEEARMCLELSTCPVEGQVEAMLNHRNTFFAVAVEVES
jgi:hypothetical protein